MAHGFTAVLEELNVDKTLDIPDYIRRIQYFIFDKTEFPFLRWIISI